MDEACEWQGKQKCKLHGVLVGKPEVNRPFAEPTCRW